MALQFQPPAGAKTKRAQQDENFAQLESGATSLAQQWRQHKLQQRQQKIQDMELQMKERQLHSQFGTGAPAPMETLQLEGPPAPGQGLPALEVPKEENLENQIDRLGTEKFNALTSRGKAMKEAKVGGQDKSFSQENQLRDQYISLNKDFRTVRDSFSRVQASATNPSAAGDLALIFNYMKILDPGSTVRESEFANAAAAGAFGERIKAAVGRVTSGERLSGEMRKDFVDRANSLYKTSEAGYKQSAKEFRRVAEKSGLDPDQVALDFMIQSMEEQGRGGDGNPNSPPAPPSAGEMSFKSETDVPRNLPKGTRIMIDGRPAVIE